MGNISVWMNVNEVLLKGGFLIFLAAAGYQDLKDRRIHICLFLAFGTAGAALKGIHMVLELRSYIAGYGMEEAWIQAGKHFKDTGMAVMVGGALLALSAATGEAVGRGDGWFFVVSGIYLDFARNLLLLCGGLILCFLACAVLFMRGMGNGRDVRHMRLPFLPFLVPAGMGVMFL